MPSMTLIQSTLNGKPTFRLIPVDKDCPYNEMIFEPTDKLLAVVSKEKKNGFKMIAKLNELGDPQGLKTQSQRGVGKPPYAEQRVSTETYYEYHITSENDIRQMVNKFAENAADFNLDPFFAKEATVTV